jgi:NADH:ubiquinone oxidoreductase subunit E
MLIPQNEALKADLLALAERYGRRRSALMPMLQSVQAKQSHISPYAMQIIADILGIHPVEVYGVVSFYSFLNAEPKGEFIIRLCRTISCDMKDKDRVARQLENELGISFGETTPCGKFTLEWANCLGMCDKGPALLVGDDVHTEVTPEKAHEIIEECRRTFGVHAAQKAEEGNH